MLLGAAASAYPNWDIYDDTDIHDGNYGLINIYDTPPNSTTVNMYGGFADYITTYDESTLNFFGGSAQIGALDNSIVNISGGNLNGADAYNYGTVNFYNGAISTSLGAYDYGISNVYGGTIDHIGVVGSGEVNIYSGLIIDSLSAYESSILNLYAYNFYYDPTGGDYDGGKITGNWILDDVYFDISLYGSDTFSHINVVPEPTMFALFGIGSLILFRKNNSKNNLNLFVWLKYFNYLSACSASCSNNLFTVRLRRTTVRFRLAGIRLHCALDASSNLKSRTQ